MLMRKLVVAILILVAAGCRNDTGTVPVAGVLKLDGQPLKEASIQFVPQGSGRDATATTDANGKFTMSTYEPRDGALPGSYKVVITPFVAAETSPEGASSEDAMAAASAAAAKQNRKSPGTQVPQSYTRLDQTPLVQAVPPKGEIVIDIKSK